MSADFQREVGEWAARMFRAQTVGSVLAHLADEVNELSEAEETDRGLVAAADEAADAYLLLLVYAHVRGFSLAGAAAEKFKMNQDRRWGEPDARGVVRHIPPGGQPS